MMNQSKPTQSLPKSDGTTSTNYGPQFEVSSTAIFLLRSCKLNKKFTVWINYTKYEPWDDIVAEIDGRILCVQLKHNEKLDKDKLKSYLEKRKLLAEKHSSEEDHIYFIYFATTPEDGIRANYPALTQMPYLLKLLLTNASGLYYDAKAEYGETFFCMNQHNVTSENVDVKQALSEFIGQHYLSDDQLKDMQIKFLDYVRKRYLRILKGSDPLTDKEIRKHVAYTMLGKLKIEYKPSNVKIEVLNNLETVMATSSVLIINHRWSSTFKDQIWCHLMTYLESKISRKHLKQANLEELWLNGQLHMPILSPSKDTDKIILRALEIGDYEPKVVILRPRIFTIKEGQNIITILQNLNLADKMLEIKTGVEIENFKFAQIDLNSLIKDTNIKLHVDAFSRTAKEYFKGSETSFKCLIEAHDEYNYVNDSNAFGDKIIPAIFAAIQTKGIDIAIIKHLIQLGANLDASIEGGFRPIFHAIDENRTDLVELLLQNHANPDPVDAKGMRPLFNACIQNKIKIANLLIGYGADRNTADVDGVRPLFMAYNNKNFEIMRLLLKDFDKAAAANTQGSNILHKAAEDGSVECLRCILECCSNVKIFMTGDVLGRTPLDIAR